MRFQRLILTVLISLAAFCQTSAKAGLPLADHVPAGSLFYVGWAGADALKQSYDASHLQAVLSQSNIPDLINQYLPQLWQKISDSVSDKQLVAAWKQAAPFLWHHPTAFYFAPGNAGQNGFVDNGLICDAGNDAPAFLSLFAKIGPNFHASRDGSVVTLHGGENFRPTFAPLSSDPAFISAMKPLQTSPALVLYVDGKSLLGQIKISHANDNPKAREIWLKAQDALGITNFTSYSMTAGFDGKDWARASFLAAPAPRTGLLAMFERKRIDPALLARIPASADSVSCSTFDAALLLDTLKAGAIAAGVGTQYGQGTGVLSVMLGRNLRDQIVGPLGPQWVIYSSADQTGMVLLNKTNDPRAAQDGLVSAVYGITNLINVRMPGRAGLPPLIASQEQINGLTVTSVSAQGAQPSFAIKDGILYVGGSSAAVVAAATRADTGPTDVSQSEAFTRARERLAVPDIGSFDFTDLPKTAPAAYAQFPAIVNVAKAIAAMANVTIPDIKLPPLDQITPHLSPALGVSWADDSGIHSKSVRPFPLSLALLGNPQQSQALAGAGMQVLTMLLPAMNRAKDQANQVASMSNERQILLACIMYADEHHGNFPPDLGTILSDGRINALTIYISPMSKTVIPPNLQTKPKDEQAAWVNQHGDYIYFGGGLSTTNHGGGAVSTTPIITEREGAHRTTGMDIGFMDGHCEFMRTADAQKMLEKIHAGENGL